ncbi:MAG: MFS transporter, partial [Rhodospirillaceae bacterium]|nr:MFS transporter [Rhodospirillaceae bacterium]
MSAGPVTGFKRIRALAAVTASMAIMAMVFGFSFPMFSTRLAEIGVSDAMIGLNASAQAFGVFLVVWFAPRLIASQGPVRIMLAMTAIKLVAVILCMLFPSFWPWLFFRLMIGATGSILWIAGETWINEIAHEKIRGRELAIYSAALGLGTVLGNLVIEVAGFDGWLPFAALAAIVTVAAVPLLFVLRDSPRLDFARHSVGLGGFLTSFKQAPLAILLNAVFAAIFVSMHSSITIYGLDVGMSLERAVQVLIVFNIGGIVMPYAAGWLADRMDRALLSFFLVLLTTMLFVVMGWALSQPGIDLVFGANPLVDVARLI